MIDRTWRAYETVASKKRANDPNWDPELITYSLSAQLKCGSDKCGELIELIAAGGIEPEAEGDGLTWVPFYKPMFLHPMPDIIRVPDEAHIEIKRALWQSFASFWSNPSGAANSARIAVERLLDELGFSDRATTKNGRTKLLTLHQRLTKFSAQYSVLGAQLMAVKWIGNTGSHTSRMRKADVLDGYEVLEDCLAELVAERSKRVAQLAKKISKKHGRESA